ncbi:unnamed protein product, partial [Mesorhabditis spiculigera]
MQNGGEKSEKLETTADSDTEAQVSQKLRETEEVEEPNGITANQALMNMCRATIGTGVLSLPLAFKQAGLWCGFLLIVIAGYFTYLSCHKLVESSQALSKRHKLKKLDYGEVAEVSFRQSFPQIRFLGNFFRLFTNFSILLMQMGICSVFTVFLKEHLEEIWTRISSSPAPSSWAFFGVVVVGLCFIVMVRHIKTLSYVSLAGNVVMSIVLLLVVQDLVGPPYINGPLPKFESLGGIILAAGNIMYAFESQAVILPLENKMRRPGEMFGLRGVLSLGCSATTIIYQLIGLFGFLKYGSAVRGAITLNLPDTEFYFFVRVLLVIVVYFTYLINQFIIVDMSWPGITAHFEKFALFNRLHLLFEAGYKVLLVLIAFLLAACVPNLGQITSLVGATAGNLLALLIPPCIHTATFLPEWLEKRDFKAIALHMSSNCLFVACGLFFMITGVIGNLSE